MSTNLVGNFIIAAIPYTEMDGRYKSRPALVVSEQQWEGSLYYLVAPKFSAVEKCKGWNEVVISAEEAVAVGMDHEGVLRFNREHLAVIPAEKVLKVMKHLSRLPELKQQALRNAARRLGCPM